MGARAHWLVRRAAAVLDRLLGAGRDGSATPTGLLHEVAKNLALSGVGRIVLEEGEGEGGGEGGAGYFDGARGHRRGRSSRGGG